jgi:autotransporter-associated beta strand protein
LIGASAFIASAGIVRADTALYTSYNDFAGTPQTGNPSVNSWEGWGDYDGNGHVNNTETWNYLSDGPVTVSNTALNGATSATNGLGDYPNDYNTAGTDPGWGSTYAGLPSQPGSVTINDYGGGYDGIQTGDLQPGTTAGAALITALQQGHALAIDFTSPDGGTTLPAGYITLTFTTYSDSTNLDTNGVNPGKTLTAKDDGSYGDDLGSFCVNHGTYWTGYLPYSYTGTPSYGQLNLVINSSDSGNITFGNIRIISPTWAAAGDGLSWTTNTSPTATDWIGGLPGGAVGGASGASATMADLESGNSTTTLDATWTLGLLTFNTLQYTYNIAPGSGGSLVMDNTANSADAAISDVAGGSATSGGGSAPNYTEYISAPVKLASNTDVTVTRSTDVLDISGNISGVGKSLSMSGAGTLELSGSNTYTGETTVNSGTLLVSTGGALPTKGAVAVNGGLLKLAPGASGGSGPAVTSFVNIGSLTIAGSGQFDLNNNHLILTYGAADPITTVAAYIKSGYNGGHWNGPGIISSVALTNASSLLYGVGYADGADGVVAGLAPGQIEVAYTLLGDANLDGLVNSADFNILAANFNQSITGWDQGDFNYDGLVNSADFNALAANFNQGVSGAASAGDMAALDAFAAANGLSMPTSVPEPATAGLLAMGAIGMMARRRRK